MGCGVRYSEVKICTDICIVQIARLSRAKAVEFIATHMSTDYEIGIVLGAGMLETPENLLQEKIFIKL